MMDLHRDFRDLLAAFVRFGVKFAIIGGYAVGHHARPRATKDLDLLVSGQDDNAQRVAEALDAFGAPPNVVSAAKKQTDQEILYMGVPPVRIDILRTADGVDTDAVLNRSIEVNLGELVVPMISLDDLLANKRAAKRPQDAADAALLEKVRERS